GGNTQDKEEANIDVADVKVSGKWDDGEDGEGSRHAYCRRQQEDELFCSCRNNVFLEEEFDAIGNGLEQPPGTDPHGAQPRLHEREDFALRVDEVSHNRGQHRKHNQDLDDRPDERMDLGKVCHSLYRNSRIEIRKSKLDRHTSDFEFRILNFRFRFSVFEFRVSDFPLPVYFAEHDIQRSNHRHHVCDEVAAYHDVQSLQVQKGRWPNPHPIGIRSSVTDHEISKF